MEKKSVSVLRGLDGSALEPSALEPLSSNVPTEDSSGEKPDGRTTSSLLSTFGDLFGKNARLAALLLSVLAPSVSGCVSQGKNVPDYTNKVGLWEHNERVRPDGLKSRPKEFNLVTKINTVAEYNQIISNLRQSDKTMIIFGFKDCDPCDSLVKEWEERSTGGYKIVYFKALTDGDFSKISSIVQRVIGGGKGLPVPVVFMVKGKSVQRVFGGYYKGRDDAANWLNAQEAGAHDKLVP